MAQTTLVGPDIEMGTKVIRALDDAGLRVRTALWQLDSEANGWRLKLAMPVVDERGPLRGYKTVREALAKQGINVPISSLQLVGVGDPVARVLRFAVRTGAHEIGSVRMTQSVLDDQFIEDAYIYRST